MTSIAVSVDVPKGLGGIDITFFEIDRFTGFSAPTGLHIFHYGAADALRTAWCISNPISLAFKDGELVETPYHAPVSPFQYKEPKQWKYLASHLSFASLESPKVTTLTALKPCTMPKQTWPDGASGRDRSVYALDKTWWVSQQNMAELASEFQLSFLLFVTTRNPQAEMNWHVFVELLCSCRTGLSNSPETFLPLLQCLRTQLEVLPEDYRDEELPFLEKGLKSLYGTANGISSDVEPLVELSGPVEVQAQAILGMAEKWGIDWEDNDETF